MTLCWRPKRTQEPDVDRERQSEGRLGSRINSLGDAETTEEVEENAHEAEVSDETVEDSRDFFSWGASGQLFPPHSLPKSTGRFQFVETSQQGPLRFP